MRFIYAIVLVLVSASIAAPQLGPPNNIKLGPYDLNRVKVGDKAPDFTLEDTNQKRIKLSDFCGKKSVVLIFYRGYW